MDSKLLDGIKRVVAEKGHEQVCRDERGVIWRVMVEDKEYKLIKTVKGEIRGGDFHQSAQHNLVLKGRIMWIEKVCLECPDGRGEEITILQEGEEYVSKPNVPHMLVSLDESVVIEWLEGSPETQYYKPYRDKVEAPKE